MLRVTITLGEPDGLLVGEDVHLGEPPFCLRFLNIMLYFSCPLIALLLINGYLNDIKTSLCLLLIYGR